MRRRLASLAGWLIPILFFFWLYRHGLRAWFQQDDFAWLGIGLEVGSLEDFLRLMFMPKAQGTIRPWSERLFFLVFSEAFWFDARPYHAWVALTQVANLLLLHAILLRLTASRLAAVAGQVVWLVGVGLSTPLSWLSTYNEVLCAFFLLAAFQCLLKAIDTGRRKWWALQWTAFVLGFGALELNVVYPALAAGYALLFARPHLRRTLWLLPVSGLYMAVHRWAAAKPTEGVYAQHWDLSMWPTYLKYWGYALAGGRTPGRLERLSFHWEAAAWLLGVVLAVFVVWSWRQGRRLSAFGVLWFTVVIGPVLPLRDHFMEYYLAIPAVGLAMVLAEMARAALERGWALRAAAAGLILLHVSFVLPTNRLVTRWRFERGERIKGLVLGLERAAELHPRKMILLQGIDTELFWSGLYDKPNRLFGAEQVFLAPGAEAGVEKYPGIGDVRDYVAPRGVTARALDAGQAVVYTFEPNRLRNITRRYRRELPAAWRAERSRLIEAGQTVFDGDLGEGWYAAEKGYRWMGKQAVALLAAPERTGMQVVIAGYCPPQYEGKLPQLRVMSGGNVIGTIVPEKANSNFEAALALPDALVGQPELRLELEVSHTIGMPGDPRELGLVFGRIALR